MNYHKNQLKNSRFLLWTICATFKKLISKVFIFIQKFIEIINLNDIYNKLNI